MSRVSYPAAARGVIAVGASTYRGCDADYSNYGIGLDLVAPGGGMDKAPGATADLRCQPKAQGYEIRQYSLLPRAAKHGNFREVRDHRPGGHLDVRSTRERGRGDRDRLARLRQHPSPRRIARRLKSTAVDRGAPGRDDVYGDGLLDASRAISPRTPCGT